MLLFGLFFLHNLFKLFPLIWLFSKDASNAQPLLLLEIDNSNFNKHLSDPCPGTICISGVILWQSCLILKL